MKNQTEKRVKKEVYVYQRGIDLWVMLGELSEDQVAVESLTVNWEKTEHMRIVMKDLIKEVKKEFAPSGITNVDVLNYVNHSIKEIFGEVVRQFDFNNSFYRKNGEYDRTIIYIKDRVFDERMIQQEEERLANMHEIEEDFY